MSSFWTGVSSLTDNLTNAFDLKGPISESANTNPDDVLNTKKALNAVGAYPEPKNGTFSGIPDRQTIDGLKQVQRQNGLKEDGIMKPNGPTAQTLNKELVTKGITFTQNTPPPTPPNNQSTKHATASIPFSTQNAITSNLTPANILSEPSIQARSKTKNAVERTEDTCLYERLDIWAKDSEIRDMRPALESVEDAISTVENEIADLQNYDTQYPHPDCIKKVPNITIRRQKKSLQRKGKKFDYFVPKPILDWLKIQLCSGKKNGETVIYKEEAIRDLEDHLQDLQDIKSQLEGDLESLEESRENLVLIYERCQEQKGR